jgi:hypothetical protein
LNFSQRIGSSSPYRPVPDTQSLETIDVVVDISPDVLNLASIVYRDPKENPLKDPRVRVIVEDGRFHLQTTDRQYDLITAEPPPPRMSGVQNLYSREFFQLVYRRLRPGGIVTYWLPIHQLLMDEAKSVIRGFCEAFPNCSLWAGAQTNWMLVGLREPRPAPTEASFARQWQAPKVAAEMQRLGFPNPESFGALFIADGSRLRAWLGSVPPLTDNQPGLIAPYGVSVPPDIVESYIKFSISPEAEQSFRESELIERIWPAKFRLDALEHFELAHRLTFLLHGGPTYENVHAALNTPELRGVIPWAFGSDDDAQQILARSTDLKRMRSELANDQTVHPHVVASAVAAGDFGEAIAILDTAIEQQWSSHRHVLESAEHLRLYFLAVRGERVRLETTLRLLFARLADVGQSDRPTAKFVVWLASAFPNLSMKRFLPPEYAGTPGTDPVSPLSLR